MTYEEALKVIEENLRVAIHDWDDLTDAFQERQANGLQKAKQALEKQIPKSPIIDGFVYCCPICRSPVEFEDYYDKPYSVVKHCVICGQKLDWSENQ